jgi:hypothetical protein
MWWKQRRPEIVEILNVKYMDVMPADIPKVTWSVILTEREFLGWTPVIARKVIGHVDNTAYPAIDVNISIVTVVNTGQRKGSGAGVDDVWAEYVPIAGSA